MRTSNQPQKIVFIDIDGPLLPRRMWAAAENIGLLNERVRDRAPLLRLDPGCVGLLVRLCDLAGARLVLASNWRRTWPRSASALLDKLIGEGLRADLWHERWMLPVLPHGGKSAEIAAWLDLDGGAGTFLFVDDEPLPLPAFVQHLGVDPDEGFGMTAYRQGLAVFGASDPRDRWRSPASAASSKLTHHCIKN